MIEQQQASGRLCVTVPMTITHATALLATGRKLLDSVGKGGVILFDLSAISETDSSSLGVIFAWARSARECGVSLRIANLPASMLSLAGLYGVSDSLPLA